MPFLQAPNKPQSSGMALAAANVAHAPAPGISPQPMTLLPGRSDAVPDSGRTAQLNHTPRLQHATQLRSRVGNGVARPTRRIQHLPPKQEPSLLPQVHAAVRQH
jgi:hypothetical protein